MITAEEVRGLLSRHGDLEPQPSSDWQGEFPLPESVARFFREVGPVDLTILGYGNDYYFPRLADLWEFQRGYRSGGLNDEPDKAWSDDWLVVADEGGDPFIVSRETGVVSYALHEEGDWSPIELFPDLNTLGACLACLGDVAVSAGRSLTDDESRILPEHKQQASDGLRRIVGDASKVERILEALGWG